MTLRGYACLLALIAAAVFLGTRFLALPWVVSGGSMEPTLSPGDRVLVDLWSYRQRGPRPGEIVLFRGPMPNEPMLVKRVARFPREERSVPRRRLWPEGGEAARETLWTLGDNHRHSVDSRSFGPVPRTRVRGRVVFRYWPPSRAGPIR